MKSVTLFLTMMLAAIGCFASIPAGFIGGTNPMAASANSSVHYQDSGLQVNTFVKGNSLFVECYLTGYSFSKEGSEPFATVAVYIDNQKMTEKHTAAFILKDIPTGRHTIRLEVLNGSGQKTGLEKEMDIHITSTL